MRPHAVIAGLTVLGMSSLAVRANASQITYGLIPSSPSDIVIAATLGGSSVLFNGSPTLSLAWTSGSMTLDTSLPALDAYKFTDASLGPISLSLATTPVTPLGTLSVTNLSLLSTATVPLSGSDPYTFADTAAQYSGSYSFTAASPGATPQSGPIGEQGQSFGGSIYTASLDGFSVEQTQGITLGMFSVGSQTLTLYADTSVKGDVLFQGEAEPVPLPAGVWLLGSGLGLLGMGRRRRRGPAADAR
jgi:hypothetical protein